MKVNPNRIIQEHAAPHRAPKAVASQDTKALSNFETSAKLSQKLAATPTVRADKVAHAKTLIADPDYPKAKTIRAVAERLAPHLKGSPIPPSA